jgi:hypothetical protein
LFFGADEDVELFMNIDEKAKTLEFLEKDETYREDLIKLFSRKAASKSTRKS